MNSLYELIGRLVFFQTTSEFYTKISARKSPALREAAAEFKDRVHLNLTRDFFVRGMLKRFLIYALLAAFVVPFFPSKFGSSGVIEETLKERVDRKYEQAMALEKTVDEMKAKYQEQQQ